MSSSSTKHSNYYSPYRTRNVSSVLGRDDGRVSDEKSVKGSDVFCVVDRRTVVGCDCRRIIDGISTMGDDDDCIVHDSLLVVGNDDKRI